MSAAILTRNLERAARRYQDEAADWSEHAEWARNNNLPITWEFAAKRSAEAALNARIIFGIEDRDYDHA